MRILGIDPGFERLGIAVLERAASAKSYGAPKKERIIFSECFKTSAKLDFSERLRLIGGEVKKIIKEYRPEVLAIETLFLNTNQKTAMRVAEARGAVVYEAALAGLRIFETTPLQIKVATTGYGRANKEQVKKMVEILVNNPVRSRARDKVASPTDRGAATSNGTDDELDAVAIALTAFAHIRV